MPSASEAIVAVGFKSLEAGHLYILDTVSSGTAKLISGEGTYDNVAGISTQENLHSLGPAATPVAVSVQDLGPGIEKIPPAGTAATVMDVPSSGASTVRKPVFDGRRLKTSML